MKNVQRRIDTKFRIMKKLLVLLVFLNTTSCSKDSVGMGDILMSTDVITLSEFDSEDNVIELDTGVGIDMLVRAMIWVESRGNDSAYCKSEEAVGCLQIRPIMVRECNRILKLQKSNKVYSSSDRWSRKSSIEIFHIVNTYYNKGKSYEAMARSWNGGPNWVEKSSTKKYWRKVKRKLKKLTKENEYSTNRFAEI